MPVIERNQVTTVIDNICKKPTYIFSVTCERRTDLHLRHDPIDRLHNGPLAYVGEASRIADRERVRYCDCGGRDHATGNGKWVEVAATSRKCKHCGEKRTKVVLEEAGTLRKMVVKGKNTAESTKHWEATPGGRLAFDPAEHDLKLVAGMYRDAPTNQGTGKRIGRHGQWRSWCLICLRTIQSIRYCGETYLVRGQLAPA